VNPARRSIAFVTMILIVFEARVRPEKGAKVELTVPIFHVVDFDVATEIKSVAVDHEVVIERRACLRERHGINDNELGVAAL
jgi:hypothetical protein